jgi:hypothetical protein
VTVHKWGNPFKVGEHNITDAENAVRLYQQWLPSTPLQLTQALINLAASGQRTHCSDPTLSQLWLSDHPGERREAVKLCQHCPLIVECRTAADARDERWHVWGGKDYTRR